MGRPGGRWAGCATQIEWVGVGVGQMQSPQQGRALGGFSGPWGDPGWVLVAVLLEDQGTRSPGLKGPSSSFRGPAGGRTSWVTASVGRSADAPAAHIVCISLPAYFPAHPHPAPLPRMRDACHVV